MPGRILLQEDFGWSRALLAEGEAWFKGNLWLDGRCREGRDAAALLPAKAGALASIDQLADFCARLDGHFAAVFPWRGRQICLVDRMRSIPLFIAGHGNDALIADQPRLILPHLPEPAQLDRQAGLEIAMAGYCLNRSTLVKQIAQLRTGELLLVSSDSLDYRRYSQYAPWRLRIDRDPTRLRQELREVTLGIIRKMIGGLDGRPIMLPLSAGLDSRLIVSALKHLGHRDVICYAYGRPDNFEAEASRRIAERLGYPWHFLPYDPARVRKMAASPEVARYLQCADSWGSLPFLQDFLAITQLRAKGIIPSAAVFVNGNSGDFISGNHIPKSLWPIRADLSSEVRRRRVLKAQVDKHFSLWRDLRTPAHDAALLDRMAALCAEAVPADIPAEADHAVYEHLECQERQSKFVISGQRVYEFFGHPWRLPLWDVEYLDFWEGIPLELKAGQQLYRDMLMEADWGGVWSDIWPPKRISPAWVRPIRGAAKLALAPFGQAAWHDAEKRLFVYWTDLLSTYAAAAPWSRLLFDRRGFRNAIAIRCEAYLRAKGLAEDGSGELSCTW